MLQYKLTIWKSYILGVIICKSYFLTIYIKIIIMYEKVLIELSINQTEYTYFNIICNVCIKIVTKFFFIFQFGHYFIFDLY